MKYSILLLLSALFLITACNPDDELKEKDLGPGQFLMDGELFEARCKVNGEDWYPGSNASNPYMGGFPFNVVYHQKDGGYFRLCASERSSSGTKLSNMCLSTPSAELNTPLVGYIGSTYYSDYSNPSLSSSCKDFELLSNDDMKLIIREVDESKRRLKATFSFTAYNECGDKVEVTDGYVNAPYLE